MSEHNKERDPLSGVETTGHEWDGLKELNNPAPRWWLWVFIICIVWAVGYWVVYPAWPVAGGATKGQFGWTSGQHLAEQQAEIVAMRAGRGQKVAAASLSEIQNNPELYAFARAGGAIAFKNNCAPCHGTGATGGVGYPNLNDDDWLWGGTLDDIYHTINVGIRGEHPDTRQSQMPAFGKDGILSPAEVAATAEYVQNLHLGEKAEQTPVYLQGKEIFAANCAACHGESGEGGRDFGAPRLNDNIWLYGGSREAIADTITNAHAGVMPSWESRLDSGTIKQLAIYVHSLGGGE